MSKKWFTQAMAILGLTGILTVHAFAGYVEASDVQSRRGDASPSQGDSNINNYIFQDEQLNLAPSDGLVKILRTDQKVLTNDFITKQIPLKNVTPREIRNVMRQVTGLEGGRAEVIVDKNTGDSFLQVMAPAYMMDYLVAAVTALDVPWLAEYNDGATDLYVKLKHRPAAAVDSIAANYAGDEGFSTVDTSNNALRRFDEVYRNEKYAKAVAMLDIPWNQVDLDVKVYEVNVNNDLKLGVDYLNWSNGPGRNLFDFAIGGYSAEQRSANLSSVYDPFIDARGFFLGLNGLDPSGKKQLIDTAARESYRSVNYLLPSSYVDFLQSKGEAKVVNSQTLSVRSGQTGVISTLDTVGSFVVNENDTTVEPDSPPVYIVRTNAGTWFIDINGNKELDDIEVNLTQLLMLVIQAVNDGVVSTDLGFSISVDPISGDVGVDLNMDGSIDTTNLIAALNSIQLQGVVANIEELIKAFDDGIEAADNISLFLAPGTVTVKDSARRVNYQNSGTVGMRLELTPYVGLKSMELVIDLDMGDLNGYAPNGTPIINTRTVATTVRLLDGQPYVIAGLKSQHDIENTGKAPLLGDIPILGYLFSGETDLKRNNEVVVTVTPRFRLSSQASIDTPAKIQTMQNTVDRELPLESAVNTMGFDQWLFEGLDLSL